MFVVPSVWQFKHACTHDCDSTHKHTLLPSVLRYNPVKFSYPMTDTNSLHPPYTCTLTMLSIGAPSITSLTVSVRRSTSPTVKLRVSTIEMLVRASICSGTFTCKYAHYI